jgi:diguanylate cyclase (GGDEF)-like protein
MGLYPLLRILAFPIFAAYAGVRLIVPEISLLGDLVLFNLVALSTALSAFLAREVSIASGILAWSIGSSISSWNSLVNPDIPDWLGDAGYVAFYPFIFFGLMSTLRNPREENRVHLIDSLIIAIGLSSLLSILALAITETELTVSGYESILKNFYPIADVLLVATALVIVLRTGFTIRNLLALTSLSTFALGDIIFLIQSADGRYQFGSLVDTIWLISLILLAESQWHHRSDRIRNASHPLLSILIAALGSGLVIALELIEPERLPNGAMIPAFITLALAFFRMSLALTEAQQLSEASYLAKTDELTGLANRRQFLEVLKEAKVGDAVILIDLNEFKPVNDNFGHGAGDELLKQVSLRLSRSFDKGWVFARLGGDEFGVLVADTTRVQEVARSISAAFSYPFHLDAVGEISISASIGVAIEDGGRQSLRHADLAMYKAKRAKEAIAFWSDGIAQGTNVSPLIERR